MLSRAVKRSTNVLTAQTARRFAANRALDSNFRLMACNRGEIGIRIARAGTELGLRTIGIYSQEDRYAPHRYKVDEAYMVSGPTPVGAYLNIPEVIRVAKENNVHAIHPGYGFLSENATFADECARNGIVFVGPSGDILRQFGDKTSAREVAIAAGVPVIPGSDGPVRSLEEAKAFVAEHGLPVIIKAAHGGGGRGMRVVKTEKELADSFNRATSEAKSAFGDGTVFIERFLDRPRHIEVQLLGDGTGDVVHLYERDCSVQRRHQKVVEIAPAHGLDPAVREAILKDAITLGRHVKYQNAGTAEFLVDPQGRHYFIEVNPRVQVEHTVTEEVTGIDIVQSQIRIANGETLKELGLVQDQIATSGNAIQVRITTEDPSNGFQPDTGEISVYRSATGPGIRLDDGPGHTGAVITPFYDSLLVKVTARSKTFEGAAAKLRRALQEFRVRGVVTNKDFLLGVLRHPEFLKGGVNTTFIEKHPELLTNIKDNRNRGDRLIRYLAEVAVNGPEPSLGASGPPPAEIDPVLPSLPLRGSRPETPNPQRPLRDIYVKDGPEAFAKAVRAHRGTLITDTTWRDAHQSLLATRVRTKDLLTIAPATRDALGNAFSIENWGGATFDVAMRFLRECPWERLEQMREAIPDIPFQMLLRGANAVGYTSYPDNAVHAFCKTAVDKGMDVFRIFDSLNYMPNMQLGIDAVGSAGGIVEAAICYTGCVTNPHQGRYNLDYYLELAHQLNKEHIHVLGIKDMAGLLRPQDARLLIGSLRKEFPSLPIHVHTHDSAGAGVASMIAAAEAGADAVDAAIDSMSGTTAQPAMGAIVAGLEDNPDLDTGLDRRKLESLEEWWEGMRAVYRPFDTAPPTATASVYEHEIPGGQLTNLRFQATSLGLASEWGKIKKSYAAANRLLGDIVKVTPSSKVCGDLAQFMVANDLSEDDVKARAKELSFPKSVIEYFQGHLGVPPYGFPEPLRTDIVTGRTIDGSDKTHFVGRPGEELPPINLVDVAADLLNEFGGEIDDTDVMSFVMYPQVYREWRDFQRKYGDVSVLPTRSFCSPMAVGDEISIDLQKGKTLLIRLRAMGGINSAGQRDVLFDVNGELRKVSVLDRTEEKAAKSGKGGAAATRPKADKQNPLHIGAPMPGVVVEVRAKEGDAVEAGQPIAVLSAMKMETVVGSTKAGVVKTIHVRSGENIAAGDLVAELEK